MREKWFLVPLAYDHIDEEKGTGSGSKARINALLKNIRWRRIDPQDCVVILNAGYTKDSPGIPAKGAGHWSSLAYQQVQYMMDLEPSLEALVRPMCWGTWDCTEHAIQRIEMYLNVTQRSKDSSQVRVIVTTNEGHMPRVKLCWNYMKPLDWEVIFIPAIHNFSPKESLRERVMYFKYLLKILKYESSHRTY